MAVMAARISGGRSAASSAGSSLIIPPMASTARAAIGSHSLDQTGRVASTHSERLQAWTVLIPDGELGGVSSHRSASRSASVTWLRSLSSTLGSPLAATVCRAMFLARSQLTGPALPGHQVGELPQRVGELLRVAERAERAARALAADPGRLTPSPATSPRRGRRGIPKPKGGSVISAASQAGWKTSMLAKLSRERWVVSNRDAKVRRGRSTRGGRSDPDGRPAGSEADRHEPRPAGDAGREPRRRPAGRGRDRGRPRARATPWPPGWPTGGRVGRVIAIDDHRGDATGVTWRVIDVRDPALAGRLAGVDVVVHTDLDLAPDSDHKARRAFNVRGAQTVLTAAAAGGVGRVVLVTSAMVYGARPDNPVPLPEDAPLGADQDGSVVGDLLEIEQLAQRSARAQPGMAVTVVRPAALVGEGVDTLITRHFEAPRLLAVKGCAPRWQFCHIDDLVSALELAAAGEVTGAFAVGCDGWLEPEQLEELSGLKRIELPAGLHVRHRAAPVPGRHHPGPRQRPAFRRLPVGRRLRRPCGRRAGGPATTTRPRSAVLLDQRAGHHAVAGRRLAGRTRPSPPRRGRGHGGGHRHRGHRPARPAPPPRARHRRPCRHRCPAGR